MQQNGKKRGGPETATLGSEGWFRSNDLRVMSPARSHCATPLKKTRNLSLIIAYQHPEPNPLLLKPGVLAQHARLAGLDEHGPFGARVGRQERGVARRVDGAPRRGL